MHGALRGASACGLLPHDKGNDMRITLQQLIDAGACGDQRELFQQRYGDSVRVTKRECIAAAQLFDWDWAAQHLLSAPARRAWNEATTTARRAYHKALAPAQRAYDKATTPARRAYDEARAVAFWRASK